MDTRCILATARAPFVPRGVTGQAVCIPLELRTTQQLAGPNHERSEQVRLVLLQPFKSDGVKRLRLGQALGHSRFRNEIPAALGQVALFSQLVQTYHGLRIYFETLWQRLNSVEVYRTDDQHVDVTCSGFSSAGNRSKDKGHINSIGQRIEGLRDNVGEPRSLSENRSELSKYRRRAVRLDFIGGHISVAPLQLLAQSFDSGAQLLQLALSTGNVDSIHAGMTLVQHRISTSHRSPALSTADSCKQTTQTLRSAR